MKTAHSLSGIALLTGSLCLAGCLRGASDAHASEGQKTIQAFESLELHGNLKVTVKVGPKPSIEIVGDSDRVDIDSSGDHLQIRSKGWRGIFGRSVEVRLTTPDLESVDAHGATDVTVTGIDGDELALESSGASEVTLEGEVDTLELELSGASEVDASELDAKRVVVDSSGASELQLKVSDELDIEASGASSITYEGDPKINQKTSGATSITKR